MNNSVINSHIKTYLIGPMEKVAKDDSGRGWRNELRPRLEALFDKEGNPLYVFDPTKEETNKVGMEPKLFHKKILGWIASGNNDQVANGTKLIWYGKSHLVKDETTGDQKLIHIFGDIDYVRQSNFLIMRMEEGDQPCGTYFEAGIALEHKIPIYVLQTMARNKYPVSFVGAVFATGGNFFNTQSELIDFICKQYNLKEKK